MKYLSVCSGIEAATVAWHPLGWTPLAFSEIEPFPRAVLQHRYPQVPLHGDFTVLRNQPWIVDADVLVGGTPCQAFSVAGLRNSLSDERGNLSLEFVRLADAIDNHRRMAGKDSAIIVWENVPGVLSVRDNAFGCFLAALAGDDSPYVPPRGKWTNAGVVDGPARTVAWRILDAQYFGLAQRRRRVFVVASARAGFDTAAVLFEFEGVRRDTPPRREAGEGFTHSLAPSLTSSGRGVERGGESRGQDPVVATMWPAEIAPTLNASFGEKQGLEDQHIRGGQDCLSPQLSMCLNAGGMGRCDAETETLIPTIGCVFDEVAVNVSPTLRAGGNRTGGDRPPGTDVDTADSLIVTHTLKAEGFDASEDGTGRGTPLVPVAFHPSQDPISSTDGSTHALGCGSPSGQASVAVACAFQPRIARNGRGDMGDVVNALNAQSGETGKGDAAPCVAIGWDEELNASVEQSGTLLRGGDGGRHDGVMTPNMAVRRLTPVECERLQGFPDDYTMISWKKKPADQCPDGPRYKALGNSMAVPCMRWIGRRIANAIA